MTHVWRGPGAQVAVSQGVEFVADATQRELAKISLGLSASGSLSGSTFEGTVRARSRDLDPATGLGVVRITLTKVHSVPVRTYGRVVITTAKREASLVIPATALCGGRCRGSRP